MNVLTTKEEVKKYLEDTAGTNSFDALLDLIILGVSQRFEAAANRKLFSSSRVELHRGGSPRIYVRAAPIVSITSIIFAEDYDFAHGLTLGTSEYVIDPSEKKNAVYSTLGVFPGREDALKVTYVGGWVPASTASSTVPEYVKQAATMQAIYIFKNRKTVGLDNIRIGDDITTKVTSRWLLPEVQDVIKSLRYRNIS